MNALRRRLLRLETANGRPVFKHLTDDELDARIRAELAEWLRTEPDACPADVRGELVGFLHGTDAGP